MENSTKMLYETITPSEYCRIHHVIYSADFNTNYPSSNYIDRIVQEINEYKKWKIKNAKK